MLQLKENLSISKEQSQTYETELGQIFNTVSNNSVQSQGGWQQPNMHQNPNNQSSIPINLLFAQAQRLM